MPRQPVRKKRRGQRDLTADVHELRYEVGDDEHGSRLDAFIARRVSWRSRSGVQNWIEEGMGEVRPFKDPQKAPVAKMKVGLKLRTGQEVVVRQINPQPVTGDPSMDPGDLDIIFEDQWLVAVNKPPHINVHPSHGHLTGSLIHLIHERHRAIYGETDEMPTLCHRLDRETSGRGGNVDPRAALAVRCRATQKAARIVDFLPEAVRQRLARNYVPIFLVVLVAWIIKVTIPPTSISTFSEIQDRCSLGPVSGLVVIGLVGLFYSLLLGIMVFGQPNRPRKNPWGIGEVVQDEL